MWYIGLILVILIIIIYSYKEEFTSVTELANTRRPVGPNSTDFFISKHLWSNGVDVFDCVECVDKAQCNHCPQFNPMGIESMEGAYTTIDRDSPTCGNVEADKNSNGAHKENIDTACMNANCEHDELYDRYELTSDMTLSNQFTQPYDIDPEYLSSRSAMGCLSVSGQSRSMKGYSQTTPFYCADTSMLGTRNDDILDGDRNIDHSFARTPGACKIKISPLKLLYKDTLGLERPHLMTDCEYKGVQGYYYKEACN